MGDLLQHSDIHKAAHDGDIASLIALLKCGHDIDKKDDSNLTPLHKAIIGKKIDAIALLIEMGANLNAVDDTGLTPLHLAVIKQNMEALALLVDSGANVEAVDNLGYSALLFAQLQEELCYSSVEELLVDKSSSTLHYKKEFLYRKLLAHAFDHKATHDTILFKAKEQIVKTIAGFPPSYYFQKMIHQGLEVFCKKHINVLPSALHTFLRTVCSLELDENRCINSEKLFNNWKAEKPIFLATGSIYHHVTVCLFRDYLIVVNRGNGNEGKQVRLLHIDPGKVDVAIIDAIRDLEKGEIEDYSRYMHEILPKLLNGSQSPKEVAIESYLNGAILPQVAGNCAWANREGALRTLLQIFMLKEGAHASICGESLAESEKLFNAISTFKKCFFVQNYLDLQENPFHPYYPSPTLIREIYAVLKNTSISGYGLVKKKLNCTLVRLEIFLERLHLLPTSTMPSEVKAVWMEEIESISA